MNEKYKNKLKHRMLYLVHATVEGFEIGCIVPGRSIGR